MGRKIGAAVALLGAAVLWLVRGTIESWFFDQIVKRIEPSLQQPPNWAWLVEYTPTAVFAGIAVALLVSDLIQRWPSKNEADTWIYAAAHYLVTKDWNAEQIVGYGKEIMRLRNEGTTLWRSEVNVQTGEQKHLKLTPEEEALAIRNTRVEKVNNALEEIRKAAQSGLPVWSHQDSDKGPELIPSTYWDRYGFEQVTDLKQATPQSLRTANKTAPNNKPIYHSLKTSKAKIEQLALA
jgi:hypothetical protein